uniref:CobW C-terminal domain-containing protein n=1 Tax=Haptolina ericina TaxID=156174 RepID=A0A7S3AMA1_9EUKA
MKGVLSVAEYKEKFVYQAVHMIFKWTAGESWGDDEPRMSKLVFIGKDLDHAELRAGFSACVVSTEVLEKKAAKQVSAEQICRWAEEKLPAALAGESVTIAEVRCSKPACPIETVLKVMLSKPKELTIFKPLDRVTHEDVVALMQAWCDTVQRGKAVQTWAEQLLPKAVAGQRVLVDEIESTHVNDKFDTFIHILATPPWSMKVLKPVKDVTKENVASVMALAALCGASGIPSVR